MIVQTVLPQTMDFLPGTPILFQSCDIHLSGDGGLLVFRQLDEQLGFTQTFASALHDPRDPELAEHTFLEMVHQRVYGILAEYEDQNDADTLRTDPIFKLLVGRGIDEPDLASQPTLSRFENSIDIPSLKRLRDLFIQQFLDSFDSPPRHLVFDLDAVDEPAHGKQQLTFWHNYYDQNQYLPLIITCANNDLLVMLSLRHGSAHAALGAADDLEYLIERVRQRWPDVALYVRGDCAFGIPELYEVCERQRVSYLFGLTGNVVLLRQSEQLMEQALAAWQQEQQAAREQQRQARPVRLFEGFWYQAGTWDKPRWVVVKAEVNEQGSQRRFVVTNRPGAALFPEACYDEYGGRGESENRHKEFKCDLHMDRLSDHRFVANYFRLYLHGLAMNLLVRLRRLVALPQPPVVEGQLPHEALAGAQRQQHFRQRRQRDVLGEGQPATWRQMLIKVAVQVVQSSRRVLLKLSSEWPYLELFQQIVQRLFQAFASPATPEISQ